LKSIFQTDSDLNYNKKKALKTTFAKIFMRKACPIRKVVLGPETTNPVIKLGLLERNV